jgi:hypothetical protein
MTYMDDFRVDNSPRYKYGTVSSEKNKWESRWPDGPNFRPMCDYLLWVVIFKITEIAHSFGLLFHG